MPHQRVGDRETMANKERLNDGKTKAGDSNLKAPPRSALRTLSLSPAALPPIGKLQTAYPLAVVHGGVPIQHPLWRASLTALAYQAREPASMTTTTLEVGDLLS